VARVLCVDAADRVLLLRWRDPVDGRCFWGPPGGGIEPGETPFEAAVRELAEETGFDPTAVRPSRVTVDRDVRWKGVRFVGPEHFFLARFDGTGPDPVRDGLLDDERRDLLEYRWVPVAALAELDDPLRPPQVRAVLDGLDAGQGSPRRRQSGR
jgi:8-oxo-dGTP pyrophosphatase MutT (NUDIX family)